MQSSQRYITYSILAFGLWLLLIPAALSAQGFNWQYSARFPTESPTLFVGVHGAYSPYGQNTTRLQHQEILSSRDTCFCAEFKNARGQEWRIGIMAEQWLEAGNIALFGALQFQYQSETFIAPGDSLKGRIINRPTLVTEYVFEHIARQVSLEVGAKYKFYPLPLFFALGVSFGYSDTAQRNSRVFERVSALSAGSYNYPERSIADTKFTIFPWAASATARLGADVPLAKGLYASPALFATWQFRGVRPELHSNSAEIWSRWSLGLHIALLLGL